jgi:hypothetical protein
LITTVSQAGKYVITHELDTQPAVVTPKDYAALLKVESMLGRKSSKVFLLEKESRVAKDGTGGIR